MVDSISLLVVDDHFLIRDGIRSILSKQDEISVIGEAANAQEAIELLESTPFEVILMDIQMPGMNGIDATKEIIRRHPGQKIIALSMNINRSKGKRKQPSVALTKPKDDSSPKRIKAFSNRQSF